MHRRAHHAGEHVVRAHQIEGGEAGIEQHRDLLLAMQLQIRDCSETIMGGLSERVTPREK
jgi:hypothetical protein